MTELRVDDIEIGERRREDMGDISALAQSIRKYGLFHPVVVDSEKRLVAGGRRLEAYRILGWPVIPVRDFGELTEQDRQEVELEENLRRKDLTPYEQSRELVRKAECVAPAVAERISSDSDEKAPQGRKSQYAAPKEDVAKAIGVGKATLVEAEQHKATAEAYPFMQNPHWSQAAVLQAKKALEKIDDGQRDVVVSLIEEAGKDVKLGVEIAEKIVNASAEEREDFFRLARSDDERERDKAATWAASRDPMPDPRLTVYRKCMHELRASLKRFPNEPENEVVTQVIATLESVVGQIKARAKGGDDGPVSH